MISKPNAGEYSPYAAGYVALATGGDALAQLTELKDSSYQLFTNLPANKADYAYADGKWTIKQVLGHMCDTERVFAYRLLCILRGEQQTLPGFEQDDYAEYANPGFAKRSIESLAEEFRIIRQSTLFIVDNIDPDEELITGSISDYRASVRGLCYVIVGHELHHLNILKERYL